MRYSLRQIQVFLAISHFENVSRAAEQLALSQSAASGALKELESLYDIQLFDRVGKRLKLNDHGKRFRVKAESLITLAQEIEEDLKQNKLIGDLSVGATLTIGNYLCVDLIEQYLNDAPEAKIKLDIANTERITKQLLNFDIDIGLLEGEIHHPDLDVHEWKRDQLICFCTADHPLANKPDLSIADLLSSAWILREQGSGTRQTFDRIFDSNYNKLNVVLELDQTEAIKRAVSKQLGISCLPLIAMQDDFDRGIFTPLMVDDLDLSRSLYIAVHKHKFQSSSLKHWLALCEQ